MNKTVMHRLLNEVREMGPVNEKFEDKAAEWCGYEKQEMIDFAMYCMINAQNYTGQGIDLKDALEKMFNSKYGQK